MQKNPVKQKLSLWLIASVAVALIVFAGLHSVAFNAPDNPGVTQADLHNRLATQTNQKIAKAATVASHHPSSNTSRSGSVPAASNPVTKAGQTNLKSTTLVNTGPTNLSVLFVITFISAVMLYQWAVRRHLK